MECCDVSSPELIEGKEIVLYIEDEHDEPKKDSPAKPNEKDVTMSGNEPLASKIYEEATCPLSDNNESRTTSNSNPNKGNKPVALADNTSPPNNIEPTNHGANNPTPHIKESRTNNNANQTATAKPNMKTPPTCPKTKSKENTISNPKSSRMPCAHACAALARVNRKPEDFCHKWLTMDAYRDTYAHYINPLPGQHLWEKSESNRPQVSKAEKKTRPLTKKRRKDADEGSGGSKKTKSTRVLKRQLKPFTCRYCLQKGHTKRGCPKKRAADVAAAAAAAAAKAKSNPQENAASGSTVDPNTVTLPSQPPPDSAPQSVDMQEVEIDISQPNFSDAQESQEPHVGCYFIGIGTTSKAIQVADQEEVLTTIRIGHHGSTARNKLSHIFQTGQLLEVCPNTRLQAPKKEEMKIHPSTDVFFSNVSPDKQTTPHFSTDIVIRTPKEWLVRVSLCCGPPENRAASTPIPLWNTRCSIGSSGDPSV
ncbi:hypothetical protein Ahy_B03g062720 [Arachis hypogaea]|uniref:CCHC-type domain-containing protein n=1 Tax=Arachis hypogaea TaxID=3818 RepID=A0A444ZV29_ARAHY|nr:hypothetical protein Ahy_B03g062720 [Arachis hypogaea]